MGWKFPWVSSHGSNFNFDFGVSFTPEQIDSGQIEFNYRRLEMEHPESEQPGMSAFYRDEAGKVFHTYSSYSRGLEQWIGTLMILDRAPLGRNEQGTMSFVRRHDEYEDTTPAKACHAERV
jgi:predicted dithiol-disulfide oxidoreductase (DUF899 family)